MPSLSSPRFSLIIPTLNAAGVFASLQTAIQVQSVQPETVLIIDSSSEDGTVELARQAGYQVHTINRNEFNHGRTRQLAVELLPEAELLIYLTQDATPNDSVCFANMARCFQDKQVGATFGRQIPRQTVSIFESHARCFNYPAVSQVYTFECRQKFGFKCVFASNSFAAYRRQALDDVGGFPENTIVSEETITFARLQMHGWKTAYVADAVVVHSHCYTVLQEFSRYFDIGVGYSRESWIYENYRTPKNEGWRFLCSELRALVPSHMHLLPLYLLRNAAKYFGYKLGSQEAHLPLWLKKRISNQKTYWLR